MRQMNKEFTVGDYIELRENVAKLNSEQQSDFLDVLQAMEKDNVDTNALIADAIRLENMRRIAMRNGVAIQKRFNRSFSESGYMLIDAVDNFAIAGARPIPYSLTLDDVEGWVQVMEESEKNEN